MRALLIAVVLTCGAIFSPLEAAEIPAQTGVITDRLGVLTAAEAREIERSADQLRQAGGELALLLQSRSGQADHRAYATEVFNRWQLGSTTAHRGVLIYLALDDRAAEIILGVGIDGDAAVAAADRIMQQQMVPRLRQGQVGAAMVAAAQRVALDIAGPALPAPAQIQPLLAEGGQVAPVEPQVEYDADPAARRGKVVDTPPAQSSPSLRPEWLFGAGGALGLLGVICWPLYRWWRRRSPPRCPHCRLSMELLDEAADDLHLNEVERSEERLRSVDYDVWHCLRCRQVQKRRYGAWFTSYNRCPRCRGVTQQTRKTTLQAATRHSTGLLRIDEDCQHCGHHASSTRVLPMLPTPSSSTHRSGGGRSSGGVRSAGRGASGRW